MTFCWMWPQLLRSVETDDPGIETSQQEEQTGLRQLSYRVSLHSTAQL